LATICLRTSAAVIDFPTCADEDFKSPEALVTGPSAWTHSKNSPFKTGRTVPWSPLGGWRRSC
jgi:hypothetical protein